MPINPTEIQDTDTQLWPLSRWEAADDHMPLVTHTRHFEIQNAPDGGLADVTPLNVYNFQKSQKLNSSTFKYIIFK
jgi:hypothetical protein